MRPLLLSLLLAPCLLLAEEAPEPSYVYRAELVRIVDGNHVALDIDLGFGVWIHNQSLALLDSGGEGQSDLEKAQSAERLRKLRELLAGASDFVVRTVRERDATPPRYLVVVWADGTNINEELKHAFP